MACLSPVCVDENRRRFRPCYRCDGCRKARAADTVTRLLVEGAAHAAVCMVTLTYRPEDLPEGGSLRPADVVGWRKRLRINYERVCARDPVLSLLPEAELRRRSRLRMFIVGEYGGKFGRGHYHAIVFGADKATFVDGISFPQLASEAWGKGSVHVGGGWSIKTAVYVSGYLLKGQNVRGRKTVDGRHPEFAMWPNGPSGGLGVPGLSILFPDVVGSVEDRDVALADRFPDRIDVCGSERLLRGFLRDRLRKKAGLCSPEIRRLKRRLHFERLRRDYLEEVDDDLIEAVASGEFVLDDFAMSKLERLEDVYVDH